MANSWGRTGWSAAETIPWGPSEGTDTTTYAYTWYSGTLQVQQATTTLPAVSTDQNGSGTSATRKQWFDDKGNLVWSIDELGPVGYAHYDSLTGRMDQTIDDIDAAKVSQLGLTAPAGWTLPASGGANATTDYQYDAFGRVTQTLGPAHTSDISSTPTSVRTAAWTVYNDANHETRLAQGYVVVSTGSAVIVGPVSITKTDRDGRVTDKIQATYSGTMAGLATATIAQADYAAWTTYQYQNTRLVSTRVYDDIPASGTGTAGTNYEQTSYGYEAFGTSKKGRQNKTVAPGGTITRVVYDARGDVLQTWMGTNDTGATDADPTGGSASGNNMVKVSSSIYDTDGNLTESRANFGSGASDYYQTLYQYDWRDRLTDSRSPANVVTHYEYDNLGRAVWSRTYASNDFTLTSGGLRAETQSLYDALGRVYESRTYEVDPANGTVSDYLPSKAWYDARGQVVKTASANGLFQKYAYDGLGRVVASYTCFDTDETAYADADDVTGDTVIEESRTWYDQAGGVVGTATYQRLPSDTTSTGDLTAANSYATASAVWYDGLGRTTATVNYGREDTGSGQTHYFFNGSTGALIDSNSNGLPDVAEAAPPAANSSDNYLVSLTQYDSSGRAYRSIDNLGRINETQFDDAGRTVRTIQNYNNGTVEEADTDKDVAVDYQYDSGGRLVTMTASNAKGSGGGVQQQATKYLYGSAVNASWQTAIVYPDSTDVLSQDSTTKVWSITTDNGDHVSTNFDRLGRTTGTTDQRGVVHEYTFDSAGRLSADTATSLGSTGLVDGSVRRIGRAYDDLGRVRTVTSYSDTSGTTAVNEVKYEYNGWGQVYREYQEHDGAVDASSLFVWYDYGDGATGGVAKYVRLTDVIYPNGRDVKYGYGTTGAIDDLMSRLASIGDGTNTQASYKYLGAGRIVTEDYVEPQVKLDYTPTNLAALDRFGRVADQIWTDYGADPDVVIDRYTYGYDRAGNRTSRGNALHTAFNETYNYNGLDELTSSARSDGYDQSWTLDGLGNWSGYNNDGSSQTRTANGANEITTTSGIATPTYDKAGNMTVIPSPTTGNPNHTLGGKYDAWNHLVEVSDGGVLIAKFSYDGTGRRIKQLSNYVGGVPQNATHYYLNGQNQVLETRDGSPTTAPESLSPKYQNIWSSRYVDAMVLRDTYSGGALQSGSRLYYLSDANYNVTAVVGKVGSIWQVVERYAYSPYGKATIYTPDWSSTRASSAYNNTTLYTGRELDVVTNLYYYRARYYSADLGTFVGRDPIGYKGSINLYNYIHNDPIDRIDPLGLCDIKIRCGPVAGFVHCGVIAPNGVEYGLGGGNQSSGSSGTATPYPTDPNQKPQPKQPGQTEYSVSCPEKSCSEVQKSIQNYHDTVTPPPYKATGPNSNTYAHKMLDAAGCKLDPIPLPPVIVEPDPPYVRCRIEVQFPPATKPPGAIGW